MEPKMYIISHISDTNQEEETKPGQRTMTKQTLMK
jgi:hypothetical protein